jgi:hypothetical protein
MKVDVPDLSHAVYSVSSSSLLRRPKKLFTITHKSPVTRVSLSPDSIDIRSAHAPYCVKYRSTGEAFVTIPRHISYHRSADPFPSHGVRLLLPPFSPRDYLVVDSTVGLNLPTLSAGFAVALTTVRPAGAFGIGLRWHRHVPLLSAKFSNEWIRAVMIARDGAFGLAVVTRRPISGCSLSANLWRVSRHFDLFFQAFRTWHRADRMRIAAALDWHARTRACGRAAITCRGLQVGIELTKRHVRAVVPRIGAAWTGSEGRGIAATFVLAPPLRVAGRIRTGKTRIGEVDVRANVKVDPLKSTAPQWRFGIDWGTTSDAPPSDVGATAIFDGLLERIKTRWLTVVK